MSAVKWVGPEALRPLLVPVAELSTHPQNPRRGDIDRIAESLARFGQMRPAPFQRSTGYIAAGNHTYRAAVEKLGWTHFAAVPADLDDEETLGYVIADNRTADLGEYDDASLASALTTLMDAGKLHGSGYTEDEADDVLAGLAALTTEPEPFGGGYSEDDAALEARKAARAAAPIMREVVLMLDPESYVRFGGFVKILQKEYETTGVIETVYQAVEREARRANTEGADA